MHTAEHMVLTLIHTQHVALTHRARVLSTSSSSSTTNNTLHTTNINTQMCAHKHTRTLTANGIVIVHTSAFESLVPLSICDSIILFLFSAMNEHANTDLVCSAFLFHYFSASRVPFHVCALFYYRAVGPFFPHKSTNLVFSRQQLNCWLVCFGCWFFSLLPSQMMNTRNRTIFTSLIALD